MLLSIITIIIAIGIEGFISIIFDEIRKKNNGNIKLLIFIRHIFKFLTLIILVALLLLVSYLVSIKVLSNAAVYVIFFMSPIGVLFYRSISPIYSEEIIDKLENFGLYLRSFKDDQKLLSGFDETAIIGVFNRIFPVFAVGQPLELLAPIGAKRIYIEENNWREQVAILSQKAKFILLKISDTDNFLWECKHCVKNVGLDKLIFFYIDDKKSNVFFKQFVNFFKIQFAIEIPDYELPKDKNFFIYFKENEPYRIDYVNKKKDVENFAICYLDTHPKLNEENEFYIKNKKKSFKNLFTLKKNNDYHFSFSRWNWGAFIFSWVYGFSNNFSSLCCVLSFVIDAVLLICLTGTLSAGQLGFFFLFLLLFVIIHFFWGINGNKTAWLSKRWAGKEIFANVQKQWNIAGIIVGIIILIVMIILLILQIK